MTNDDKPNEDSGSQQGSGGKLPPPRQDRPDMSDYEKKGLEPNDEQKRSS